MKATLKTAERIELRLLCDRLRAEAELPVVDALPEPVAPLRGHLDGPEGQAQMSLREIAHGHFAAAGGR